MHAEWCTIYCEQDGKCHTTSVKKLEAEDSEILLESHLVKGGTVIWKYGKKKYTATIVNVHGK
jgi:hypothetical protein